MEQPDTGTSRPDDTYCPKCDVFGHALGSVACEVYQAEVEVPYHEAQLKAKARDARPLSAPDLLLDELYD